MWSTPTRASTAARRPWSRPPTARAVCVSRRSRAGGDSIQLTAADFGMPPEQLATVTLPTPYAPNRHDYRREVGRRVKNAKLATRRTGRRASVDEAGAAGVRHPVGDAPGRGRSRPPGTDPRGRSGRPRRARDRRARKPRPAPQPVVGAGVRRRAGVLSTFGYVDREAWALTEAGAMLARTFHESRPARHPVSAARAARRSRPPPSWPGWCRRSCTSIARPTIRRRPWFPSDGIKRRWRSIAAVSEDLAAIERSYGLAEHRPPEPTFIAVAYAWIAGDSFAQVVADEELTGGDFVRTIKQLIDLLNQVAIVAPDPDTRRARAASGRRCVPRRGRRFRVRPLPWSDDDDRDRRRDDSKGCGLGRAGRPARRTRHGRLRCPSSLISSPAVRSRR